jgi:hypothetical protein
MNQHRRLAVRAALAAGAAATVLLAGCATFAGPRDYDVPLAKLQRNLDQRFPIEHRALAVFDLRLVQPKLETMPNDRIALTALLSVSSPLMRQEYTGTISLSGRLNIDQSRNAVMLADTRLEDFTLDGLDERTQRQVSGAARVLANNLAHDTPIYTWRPDELRYAGVQFVPTAIRTSSSGLSIHLEPMRDGRL